MWVDAASLQALRSLGKHARGRTALLIWIVFVHLYFTLLLHHKQVARGDDDGGGAPGAFPGTVDGGGGVVAAAGAGLLAKTAASVLSP